MYREYQRRRFANHNTTYDQHVRQIKDLHDHLSQVDKKKSSGIETKSTQSKSQSNNSSKSRNNSDNDKSSDRKKNERRWSEPTRDMSKFCEFCKIKGHDVEDCWAEKRKNKSSDDKPSSKDDKDDES